MKLTPNRNPLYGPKGEAWLKRVEKSRKKKGEAIKTKKRQRKLNK